VVDVAGRASGGRTDRFREAVASLALVSIDLLVEDAQGRFLLGKRRNPPAQGWWFVPGGRICKKGRIKEERISAALRRLMREELGLEPGKRTALGRRWARWKRRGAGRQHGSGGPVFRAAHEHFCDTKFANEAGSSTHYVMLAYALCWPGGGAGLVRWMAPGSPLACAGIVQAGDGARGLSAQ